MLETEKRGLFTLNPEFLRNTDGDLNCMESVCAFANTNCKLLLF